VPPTDFIIQYSAKCLGGRTVPDDLRKLLKLQWRDLAGGRGNRLERAGVTLLDSLPELIVAACAGRDHLGGATRLAYAQATSDMVRCSAFVAEDDTTGDAIGYWFGPDRIPIEIAPLLRFDTDFNFSIVLGNNIAEAILVVASRGDQQSFCDLREYLNELGLDIAARSIQDIQPRKCAIPPQVTYQRMIQAYSADLSAALLPNIGGPADIMTIHRGPKIDLEPD
jgi:hypothetical protein